jgi:hypothetical protein
MVQWGYISREIIVRWADRNHDTPLLSEYATCTGIVADRGDSAIMIDCLAKIRKDRTDSTNYQLTNFTTAGRSYLYVCLLTFDSNTKVKIKIVQRQKQ